MSFHKGANYQISLQLKASSQRDEDIDSAAVSQTPQALPSDLHCSPATTMHPTPPTVFTGHSELRLVSSNLIPSQSIPSHSIPSLPSHLTLSNPITSHCIPSHPFYLILPIPSPFLLLSLFPPPPSIIPLLCYCHHRRSQSAAPRMAPKPGLMGLWSSSPMLTLRGTCLLLLLSLPNPLEAFPRCTYGITVAALKRKQPKPCYNS